MANRKISEKVSGQMSFDKAFIRSKLLSFSVNFIAGILVLSYVGYRLDIYFEQENHLFLLIGVLLGIIWSMYETFKLTKIINKDK